MKALFVKMSENRKTGPIPVVMTSGDTCPSTCPLKGHGCYGAQGPLRWIWNKVDDGRLGGTWDGIIQKVAALPLKQLWRYGVVGDLPGEDGEIDQAMLEQLVAANQGKKGFAYTHKPMTPANAQAVRKANKAGFTINLSANTLAEVDALAGLGVGPVVVSMPKGAGNMVTPGGRKVVICPAYAKNTNCSLCQICAKAGRKAVIGFPAHGSQSRYVGEVFNGS